MIEVNLKQIRHRLYADGCTDLLRGMACLRWSLQAGKSYAEAIQPWKRNAPYLFDQRKARARQRAAEDRTRGATPMLEWVSIRDPIARAKAKAAYCEKHPLPQPAVRRVVAGPKQGHYVSASGHIHPYGGAAGRRVAKWPRALTASQSRTCWFPLRVPDN